MPGSFLWLRARAVIGWAGVSLSGRVWKSQPSFGLGGLTGCVVTKVDPIHVP